MIQMVGGVLLVILIILKIKQLGKMLTISRVDNETMNKYRRSIEGLLYAYIQENDCSKEDIKQKDFLFDLCDEIIYQFQQLYDYEISNYIIQTLEDELYCILEYESIRNLFFSKYIPELEIDLDDENIKDDINDELIEETKPKTINVFENMDII